jgi:hypothetical protein
VEKIGQRPGGIYVEIDPNIENTSEFPGLANGQLDSYAAAGPLGAGWPDLGVLKLQDSSAARLEVGDCFAQRTREGDPVGCLATQCGGHAPNIGKKDEDGIPMAVRIVAAIIAAVTGLSRGSAPMRSELP